MTAAATISSTSLSRLYETLPCYETYEMQYNAETDESSFRQSLAHIMRDLGDRMLSYAETRGPALDPQKLDIIDVLIDDIGECLKVLNRRGKLRNLSEDKQGVSDLETVDNKLIMLLEQMTDSVDSLVCADPALFPINAHDLAVCIDGISDLIEERNRLLGMGWESEMRLNLFNCPGQESI